MPSATSLNSTKSPSTRSRSANGRGRNQKPQKQSNTAKLREVTVKACEGTGEIMVVLTVTGKQLPNAEDIVYAMDDAIDEVSEEYALESVILEVKKGDIHDFAKDYIPLAGKRTINDRIQVAGRDLEFEISGSAFYQVNTNQMTRLYEKAREYAGLSGEEVSSTCTAASAPSACLWQTKRP